MDNQPSISNDNPYQSPSSLDEATPTEYPSARKAIVAGAWRGAKFGGKWMGLILGCILVAANLVAGAEFLYRKHTWPNYSLPDLIELLKGIGSSILIFLYTVFVTAVVSAIITGIGEGISYWRSRRKAGIPQSS